MKQKKVYLFIGSLCVGLLLWAFINPIKEETATKLNSVEEAVYFIDLPSGLDTLEFKATITLQKNLNKQIVQFPNGGTATTVLIFDDTYLDQPRPSQVPKPLVKGSFSRQEAVRLDISALPPNKYYVHYLSCGLGGIFPLQIK